MNVSPKPKIQRIDAQVRKHIEQRLRENRLTLDELLAELQEKFPGHTPDLPTRSALHRYSQDVRAVVLHESEMQAAAQALVDELGENFDDLSGVLLTQSITTLVSTCVWKAMRASKQDADDTLDLAAVRALAEMAKLTMQTRAMSLKERQGVAAQEKAKLLEEQRAKLEAMGSKGGVTEDTKKAIREALGIV